MPSVLKKSLRLQMMVSLIVMMVFVLLGSMFFAAYTMKEANDRAVFEFREMLYNDFKKEMKVVLEMGMGQMEYYQRLAAMGVMSEGEAQKKAIEAVGAMRYDQANGAAGKTLQGTQGNYVWIDRVDGVNMYHPDPKQHGKQRIELADPKGTKLIQRLIANAKKDGDHYSEFWFAKKTGEEAKQKIGLSKHFAPWGWVLCTGSWTEDINLQVEEMQLRKDADFKKIMLLMMGISLFFIFVVVGVAWVFSSRFIKPISELANDIEVLTRDKDFTIVVDSKLVNREDEIGKIAFSLAHLVSEFRVLIATIQDQSVLLEGSSRQMTEVSDDCSQRIERVATVIQEVAKAASEQRDLTKGTVDVFNEMSVVISHVAKNTEQLAENSTHATESAQAGEVVVSTAIAQMEQITNAFHLTASGVFEVQKMSDGIAGFVQTITQIAGQTNLLALNAAIEAARAGEQGRGFAVVADEVRKLAEESKVSAEQVKSITEKIQIQIRGLVESIDANQDFVQNGSVMISKAGESFTQITGNLTALNRRVHEISAAMEENAASAESSVVSAKKVEVHSEEIARKSEEIYMQVHDASKKGDKDHSISETSNSLSALAHDLTEMVKQFKV